MSLSSSGGMYQRGTSASAPIVWRKKPEKQIIKNKKQCVLNRNPQINGHTYTKTPLLPKTCILNNSVLKSSVLFNAAPDLLGHQGDLRDDSAGPLPDSCEQFWHGQGCPLFDVVQPTFSLPTMVLPIPKGAPKDGLERLSCAIA